MAVLVGSRSKPEVKTETNALTYSCNAGRSIVATFYDGPSKVADRADMPPIPGGSVDITLSDGRKMKLNQTISADGVRYANGDESFVFWTKGNGALVLENNVSKTYIGCIVTAKDDSEAKLPVVYSNGTQGFSIRLPSLATSSAASASNDYTVDESYSYDGLGPNKNIGGVKFTIPQKLSVGTNLAQDTYLSIEQVPMVAQCSASAFIYDGRPTAIYAEEGRTYSVASSSDAGAGNRYNETVFALPDTKPCTAVRYWIHYGVYENYPEGSITRFDEKALVREFDRIRKSLVINQ
jgi:membrane-bound inhibitor of C-type lysozyme